MSLSNSNYSNNLNTTPASKVPSWQDSNLYVNLSLLIVAILKATGVTLVSDAFDLLMQLSASGVAFVNILMKIEWRSVNWLNFTKSSNFYLQAFGSLILLFPIVGNFVSGAEFEVIVNAVKTGNVSTILASVFPLLIKIIAQLTATKPNGA